MPNITLSIPEEIYKKMKKMSDIKWSEIARRAIEERINDLETLNRIASKSKFTDKDIEELSEKIKKGIAKRHKLIHSDIRIKIDRTVMKSDCITLLQCLTIGHEY